MAHSHFIQWSICQDLPSHLESHQSPAAIRFYWLMLSGQNTNSTKIFSILQIQSIWRIMALKKSISLPFCKPFLFPNGFKTKNHLDYHVFCMFTKLHWSNTLCLIHLDKVSAKWISRTGWKKNSWSKNGCIVISNNFFFWSARGNLGKSYSKHRFVFQRLRKSGPINANRIL